MKPATLTAALLLGLLLLASGAAARPRRRTHDSLTRAERLQLGALADPATADKYLQAAGGQVQVDSAALLADGFSHRSVEFLEDYYRGYLVVDPTAALNPDAAATTKGIKSAVVKKLAQFLRDNWTKIFAKLDSWGLGWVKTYLKIDIVLKVLDMFTGISNTVHDLLLNVFRYIIPGYSWDWAAEWIVKVIELIPGYPF